MISDVFPTLAVGGETGEKVVTQRPQNLYALSADKENIHAIVKQIMT